MYTISAAANCPSLFLVYLMIKLFIISLYRQLFVEARP